MKTFWILLFFLISTTAYNQEQTQKSWGLSASLQNNQFDIGIPSYLSQTEILIPSFNVLFIEQSGWDLGVGLAFKHYTRSEKIDPFISVRAGSFFTIPKKGKTTVDLTAGLGAGADYFFDEKFSIGIEAQLNLTKSNKNSSRFGNPSNINVNTASAVVASIYF